MTPESQSNKDAEKQGKDNWVMEIEEKREQTFL